MRDETFTDEQINLCHRLHQAGVRRSWQPGDRLIGGERPVRVVRSVSVEGDPLVEVERGGRVQTVGVAQPRIWLPTAADVIHLLGEYGYEGALMFRAERFGLKFRRADAHDEYRLITGDDPRTIAYRALVVVHEEDIAPVATVAEVAEESEPTTPA